MGEVQGPRGRVTVDPRDGPVVALEHLANARFAAERTDEVTLNGAREMQSQMSGNDLRPLP